MKYKVGDRVRIKSIDWYNENKDEHGDIDISHDFTFYADRSKYCGRVFTIDEVFDNCYTVKEDNHEYYWADEMIEGLVQDENNHLTETVVDTVRESNDRYRIVIDPRFDIEVDEGEYYAVRRKKEYPKTYEECLPVLEIYNRFPDVEVYNAKPSECKLFESFIRLKRCRDAYWKIVGDEMGLGKPWVPDWNDTSIKYCLERDFDAIDKNVSNHKGRTFAFPTPEMRDTFKENFYPDLEICKEFL